jgi:hypothetical protein
MSHRMASFGVYLLSRRSYTADAIRLREALTALPASEIETLRDLLTWMRCRGLPGELEGAAAEAWRGWREQQRRRANGVRPARSRPQDLP